MKATKKHKSMVAAVRGKRDRSSSKIQPAYRTKGEECMGARPTILVISHSSTSRKIIGQNLSASYRLIEAGDAASALEILSQPQELLAGAVLDLFVDPADGYKFLSHISSDLQFAELPIIAIIGSEHQGEEKRVLNMGAWDFVPHPCDGEILNFRLKNAMVRSKLAAFQQLKYVAEYDALTGLYNKQNFFTKAREMLSSNPDEAFVFIRLDVQRFQLINSFFGTQEGDRLICYMARLLAQLVAQMQLCIYGHIEADVFGICVAQKEIDIMEMIDKMRGALSCYHLNYNLVPIFGLYRIINNALPVSTFFDYATIAAKECKKSYLSCFVWYSDEMRNKLKRTQEIISEMDTALAQRQFEIYLQPKYNLRTHQPAGAEALVRWRHPEKGIISPGEFIPIFEGNGFITKLDYYVWEQACMLLAAWKEQGLDPQPISVNVSRVNLYHHDFVGIMLELVRRYRLKPRMLQLEMTETAYTDSPEIMCKTVAKLREEGFEILMDDFGSGYSSLNILKDIEVDILKIDMRFLSESASPGRGENIIASVVRMAKWLSIPVVMEGVETSEQVEFLRSINCDYVQGFYFARPIPASEYELFLRTERKQTQLAPLPAATQNRLDKLWVQNPEANSLFGNFVQPAAAYEFADDKIELVRVNNAVYKLFGQEDALFSIQRPIELVREDCRAAVVLAFRRAVHLKSSTECTYARQRADGSTMWVRLQLQYVDRVGDRALLFGLFSDVTVQKRVDEELKKCRAREFPQQQQLRVMVASAGGEISAELRQALRPECALLRVESSEQAKRVLEEQAYQIDLIFLEMAAEEVCAGQFWDWRNMLPELEAIPVFAALPRDGTRLQQLEQLSLQAVLMPPYCKQTLLQEIYKAVEVGKRKKKQLYEKETAALCDAQTSCNLSAEIGCNPSPATAQTVQKTVCFSAEPTAAKLVRDNARRAAQGAVRTAAKAEAWVANHPSAAVLILRNQTLADLRDDCREAPENWAEPVQKQLESCFDSETLIMPMRETDLVLLLPEAGNEELAKQAVFCVEEQLSLLAGQTENDWSWSAGYAVAPLQGKTFTLLFAEAKKAMHPLHLQLIDQR